MKTVSKLNVITTICVGLILMSVKYLQQGMTAKLPHGQLVGKTRFISPTHLTHNGLNILHQESLINTTEVIRHAKNEKKRPDKCSNCFQRPYKFVFASPKICQTASGEQAEVDLVVVIASAPERHQQRDLVRSTWVSVTKNNTWSRARYVFLLAHSHLDLEMKHENDLHSDMALQDFKDSYKNLTLKTLMGLEWFIKFCPWAKNLMKTDDDVLVHIHNVLHLIDRRDYNSSNVHGRCHPNMAPIRDPTSRWYTPYSMYPHPTYPAYCGGYGYIMAHRIVKDILTISPNVPFFTWEDVYVGLCLKELGYNVRKVTGYKVKGFRGPTDQCSPYNQWRWCIAHDYRTDHRPMSWAWKRCILPELEANQYKS